MTTARQVASFLRSSWERSIASVGVADLIIGLGTSVIGRAMNIDLGLVAVGLVLAFLIVRVLILSPAALLAESRRPAIPTSIIGSVEKGGVVNVFVGADGLPVVSQTTTGSVNPAAPRSRRTTKRGPKSPPPSRAS